MWTRDLLKRNAKFALKNRYWMAFLASFIVMVISGGTSGMGSSYFSKDLRTNTEGLNGVNGFFTQNSEWLLPVIGIAAAVGFFAACAGIVYSVFISSPVGMGQNRYYLQNRMGKADLTNLFAAFKNGYLNVVKVLFFKNLYIFLWSFLFVIPGIIKAFEYFAVDYIMAENPEMDLKHALEISRAMTEGEKWEIFVLALSFIGWGLLCLIPCGIGLPFLAPYVQATFAELYTALREKALVQNLAGIEELPGVAAV